MDRRTALLAGGAALVLPHGALRAQAFPSHAITLYCAFPAGGPTDQVMRAFAEVAARELKQSVIVESKPGGGGTIAPLAVRAAKPDGYTLSQIPLGVFRIPHMQKAPQLDPLKDFTYIINLTGYTFGLVVPAGAPWKTLKEYVDDARKNPGKIDYGSTGTGTTPHLAMEEFSQKAGIKLTHVPYKGSAELMAAVLGGHLMSVSDSTGFAPQVEAGKLRLLATFGSEAHQALARRADAQRTRLRHDLRFALRRGRARRHGYSDRQGAARRLQESARRPQGTRHARTL